MLLICPVLQILFKFISPFQQTIIWELPDQAYKSTEQLVAQILAIAKFLEQLLISEPWPIWPHHLFAYIQTAQDYSAEKTQLSSSWDSVV